MALDVYVCGVPGALEGPCWRVETAWWDGRSLLRDPRFRKLPFDRTAAVLGPDDVLALNRRSLQRGATARVRARAKALEERIEEERDRLAFLVVVVSEWSGGHG